MFLETNNLSKDEETEWLIFFFVIFFFYIKIFHGDEINRRKELETGAVH